MKRALVTSLGARSTMENYGAVLQIVSFCQILNQKYQINCDVLDYIGINCKGYKDPIIIAQNVFADSFKGKLMKLFLGRPIYRRYIKNLNFMKKQVSLTKLYDYITIESQSFDYDYYIAESDVIWDPSFRKKGFDDVFFLKTSAFKGGKKIVYSAGLGDAHFSEKQRGEFLENIKKIDNWCVREEYSKMYIKKFYNGEVKSCLDPTLLVKSSFYSKFICELRPIKSDYVLIYTPGFKNQKMIDDAYKYAKKTNCKVIIIRRYALLQNLLQTKVNVGVEEFLNYLFYCKAFFCDSFHGVCLAVSLRKNFYVYEREDGKKISDICVRLGLFNRIVKGNILIDNINYDDVYLKLEKERKCSFEFLDLCFMNIGI